MHQRRAPTSADREAKYLAGLFHLRWAHQHPGHYLSVQLPIFHGTLLCSLFLPLSIGLKEPIGGWDAKSRTRDRRRECDRGKWFEKKEVYNLRKILLRRMMRLAKRVVEGCLDLSERVAWVSLGLVRSPGLKRLDGLIGEKPLWLGLGHFRPPTVPYLTSSTIRNLSSSCLLILLILQSKNRNQ